MHVKCFVKFSILIAVASGGCLGKDDFYVYGRADGCLEINKAWASFLGVSAAQTKFDVPSPEIDLQFQLNLCPFHDFGLNFFDQPANVFACRA